MNSTQSDRFDVKYVAIVSIFIVVPYQLMCLPTINACFMSIIFDGSCRNMCLDLKLTINAAWIYFFFIFKTISCEKIVTQFFNYAGILIGGCSY